MSSRTDGQHIHIVPHLPARPCRLVARLPVAAPEVVTVDGELWIVALTETLDGMRVARLELVPSSDAAGTQADETVEAA